MTLAADISSAPPCDLDAEMALLGAWLLGEAGVLERSRVAADAFYRVEHRRIAGAALSLADDGVTPDAVLVGDRIRTDLGEDRLRELLGMLSELPGCVPGPAHAEHYAEIVRRKAAERRVLTATQQLDQDLRDGRKDRDQLAADVRALADEISGEDAELQGWASDWVEDALADLELKRDFADASTDVLSWGIYDLERWGCVLRPDSFPVVAGRPGSGKTTFLLGWAVRTAHRTRAPIVYLSLEMHPASLLKKAMLGWARIPDPHYKGLPDEHRRLIDEAVEWARPLKLLLPHRFPRDLDRLCSWIYTTVARVHPCAVVIDHIGLVQSRGSSPYERVTATSRRLRQVQLALQIPLVCAAQLNRRVGNERDLPGLHDLRDSGAIEEDATEVLMLHRPWDAANSRERDNGGVDPEECVLVVRKNRYGPSNRKVPMRFVPERSTLEVVDVYAEAYE